jgi:hypothetical protein
MLAVDGLGKDTGTGGFAHAAGSTKEIGVRELLSGDGLLERGGDNTLPHNAIEMGGPILTGRDDEITHLCCQGNSPLLYQDNDDSHCGCAGA